MRQLFVEQLTRPVQPTPHHFARHVKPIDLTIAACSESDYHPIGPRKGEAAL